MKNACLGLIALAIATSTSIAQAEERTHDGFMLRLTGGAGYASATEELDASLGAPIQEFTLSGPGISFSVDVGGSPIDNLVLHARFGATVVSSPAVEINGEEVDIEVEYGQEDDSSLTFIFLGPAITYYVMPANLYFTGAFGMGLVGVRVGNESGRTDPGWAINLDAGWEFWVGQSWGMGPALRFFYTSVPDDIEGTDNDPTVNGWGLGVLFSATFQ